MKDLLFARLALAVWLVADPSVHAAPSFHKLVSPDHGQTFAYGSDTNRVLRVWGPDRHLALLLTCSNDPYVDRQNPRQIDSFRFNFPSVRLGGNQTFYYHASGGRKVPVAVVRSDFLGFDEVRLLDNANLVVDKRSGYLTVCLNVIAAQ